MSGKLDFGAFPRMVEVMLPRGGVVMALAEAYFDESGTDEKSTLICVAGYVLEEPHVRAFAQDWREVLDWKGYNLPYFRMSECAPEPPSGAFKGIPIADRIQIVARLIGVIKKHTNHGIAITVSPQEYDKFMPKHPLLGTAYSFCTSAVMNALGSWSRATNYTGKIAYFFEAGHSSQPEANALMNLAVEDEKLRDMMRYSGHAFLLKEESAGTQAADLLAWLWRKDVKDKPTGRRRRKDCESLLAHTHITWHITPEVMAAFDLPPFGPESAALIQTFMGHKLAGPQKKLSPFQAQQPF